MQVEIPEQAKLQAVLLANAAIAGVEDGGDAVHAALAMFRRAIAMNPLDLGHRYDLARFLIDVGENDEAHQVATWILKHSDKVAGCWGILSYLATVRGEMGDAITYARRAYELEPGNGARKWDLAAAFLRAGDFINGWPWYECRNESLPSTGPRPNAPDWTGEKVGHLAVWPDQGYGDTVMFARFLPWARERCDKLTVLVNPQIFGLMQGYSQICNLTAMHSPDAVYDAQVRITSLAMLYGANAGNIPLDPGMLSPAPSDGTIAVGEGLKIGIAWQGNPKFPNDKLRSIPFREFLPLAADPRNHIFSLQMGAPATAITRARASRIVRDMSAVIDGEWTHTAALIQQLDLVVTSCTAIAHVAGALGKPVYLMIPAFADWRWMSGRDDTPWYPHTRLFRQSKVGQWSDVVARVSKAIGQLHDGRALAHMVNRQIAAASQPYEPEVAEAMKWILRKGDFFIDVGANEGIHTLAGADLVGEEGKVWAFEPGSNVLPALHKATRRYKNVAVLQLAVTNKVGHETFYLNADNSGGNALWDPATWPGPHNPKSKVMKEPIEVATTTLDHQLCTDALNSGIPIPRLIKIDTEGAEQLVLEGARSTLMRISRPFIIAELHEFGLESLGCTQESLRAYMESLGYSTFTLHANGRMPALVPSNSKIGGDLIVNLLFATPEMVGEAWGNLDIRIAGLRPLTAYGIPDAPAAIPPVQESAA